jgi:hypothetical protein
LIDFGFSDTFLATDGNHVDENCKTNQFKGNMLFSSVRQLSFMKTSRRDDLISLCYLLVYLLNKQKFPDKLQKKGAQCMTPIERLEMTRNYKESITIEDLIRKVTNQTDDHLLQTMLLEFVINIKKLSFNEEPDYLLLKQILLNSMQLVP